MSIRKSRNSRWRALSLTLVHVLIALHMTHWLVTGRSLSPVEPSESMYTLELGELNAGFVFFLVALLMTIAFGRFFCGWGCHVVALQDLCAAFMKRIGIKPRPFRSRLLRWMPLVFAFYMFIWPNFKRWILFPILDATAPALREKFQQVATFHYENALMTEAFWETFPHWAVAVPFLFICGFVTVYLLGAKGFCTYGCPYGAFFVAMDKISPGRIVADLDKCKKCGHCTATCTSNVRIHEEIQVYSMVVDSGCMKCMDCVSVCPNNALSFGFANIPAAAKPIAEDRRVVRRYDLSWPQEFGLLILFATVFFATRGAYGQIPMLMALGIALCVMFLGYKSLQLLREREVRFNRAVLKRGGRWRGAGIAFASITLATFVICAHTGYIQFQIAQAQSADDVGDTESALVRYQRIRPLWHGGQGLLPVHFQDPQTRKPLVDEIEMRIVRLYLDSERVEEAVHFLERERARNPESERIRDALVGAYLRSRKVTPAASVYLEYLKSNPGDALTRAKLASRVYLPSRQFDAAIKQLERAIEDAPKLASLHNDLAVAYRFAGRSQDAIDAMRRATQLDPDAQEYHQRLSELLREANE